ncbi:unnamed protein product [Debaryomyces tyrocola]|nr:unnamed protein product [Debaryomyces tyrocola]
METKLISSGSTFEKEIGYPRVVVVDEMTFVSGTTGYDYTTMEISDNGVEQVDQTIRNIESALAEAGFCLQDVIKATYIFPDASEFERCWPTLRK